MKKEKAEYFRKLFKNLKKEYTQEEAKKAIDALLAPYGPTVKITFRRTNAEIIDSCLVGRRARRYKVCEILRRSGVTERSVDDLAAEWQLHTLAYKLHLGRQHAKDVSLDYKRDPHLIVRLATAVFDLLEIE